MGADTPDMRTLVLRALRHPFALVALSLIAVSTVALAADRSPGMQRGREFDQVTAVNGSVQVTGQRSFKGARSMIARYHGDSANGYARGLFEVSWHRGETVRYKASFFLPRGFHRAMQGQVALMRWDNWPSHEKRSDHGGIVIYGSDKLARLVRVRVGAQRSLGRSFELPEGRWFTLSVRQRLSKQHPRSRVLLDGRRIASSTKPNFYGRPIERIRYGIVAIGAGLQRHPLHLWFDEASKRAAVK